MSNRTSSSFNHGCFRISSKEFLLWGTCQWGPWLVIRFYQTTVTFCTSYSYWMAEFLTQGCRGWLQSSRLWPSCCTVAPPSSLLQSFVTKELMSLEDNFLQNLNKSLLEAQEMWTLIRTSKPKMMKAYGSSNSGLSILDSNQMLKFCSSVEASNCLLLMLTMILFANFIIHGWWIYS